MGEKKETLWTVPFVLDTVINLLVFLIYYLLMVIIAVVARIFAGRFVGTLGCRRVLYGGLFIYLISTILYFYIPNLLVLDTIRFVNGFAYGVTSTATSTIVATVIPKTRRGEGINYYGLSLSLAAAIGPFLGILMLSITNFTFIVAFCVALVILCIIGAFLLKFEEPTFSAEVVEEEKGTRISDFLEPRVNSISLVSILVGLSYSGILGFMASYTREVNLVEAGTLFFVVYAIVITLTRPVLGIIFDRHGENCVMYPSYVCLAIGIVLLSQATASWMVLLSAVFVGLGYGTYMSNGQAVVIKMVPVHRIGVATSTYFIALDLGLGVGPYILGAWKETVGFTGMFSTTAVIALVALVCYFLFYGRLVGTDKDPSLKAQQEDEAMQLRMRMASESQMIEE